MIGPTDAAQQPTVALTITSAGQISTSLQSEIVFRDYCIEYSNEN